MTDPKTPNDADISAAIRYACQNSFGVLDSNFLCQSVGILNLKEPISIENQATLGAALDLMKGQKIGCLVVTDEKRNLKGIFTERDVLNKVVGVDINLAESSISDFMTKEPITIAPDVTIAYALNLMSQGGFRHLPVVDESNMIIGVISVKDVVDYVVDSFTKDLLQFETSN